MSNTKGCPILKWKYFITVSSNSHKGVSHPAVIHIFHFVSHPVFKKKKQDVSDRASASVFRKTCCVEPDRVRLRF
jgi:hypothetical protein